MVDCGDTSLDDSIFAIRTLLVEDVPVPERGKTCKFSTVRYLGVWTSTKITRTCRIESFVVFEPRV